ncbi:hypothetical protein QT381_03670 [Galbitalea sp. SE-J8]|uniref:hypothetical protein n=1 Tax=Galbitalea sp. SE-J8 TaxID=3054952 RepID=UPI00259CA142|nr:hypothetical protein [Galbitalea sp. SE-J8]MDM4762102.1 hypothetical protein [Galbitalea sp. SE-J8]
MAFGPLWSSSVFANCRVLLAFIDGSDDVPVLVGGHPWHPFENPITAALDLAGLTVDGLPRVNRVQLGGSDVESFVIEGTSVDDLRLIRFAPGASGG